MRPTSGLPTDGADEYDAGRQQLLGVRLTHPDKLLFPEAGITKLELAEYYRAVAEWISPHIKDRPLVLVRCPEGQEKECFFQKHPGVGTPATLRQIPVQEKTKTERYAVVDDVSGAKSRREVRLRSKCMPGAWRRDKKLGNASTA